jgi:hypothetical protein
MADDPRCDRVGSYWGYTGPGVNVVAKPARDPKYGLAVRRKRFSSISRLCGLASVIRPLIARYNVRAGIHADAVQRAYPDGPIDIVVDSMGGLDSRTLICEVCPTGRVASLTTLSTAHRGVQWRTCWSGISQALGLLGIDIGALANLTTQAASSKPRVAQTHQHIRFLPRGALPRPTSALALVHEYIRAVTGQENDGLAAKDAAKYG